MTTTDALTEPNVGRGMGKGSLTIFNQKLLDQNESKIRMSRRLYIEEGQN